MEKASLAMVRGPYKLINYISSEYNLHELYDLAADPQELVNLYDNLGNIAKAMEEELLARFTSANQPYLR